MPLKLKKRFLVYSLSSLFCLSYNTEANSLPITSDGSLGTRVEMRGNKIFIGGGTQKGSNLFHSTAQFSIPQNIEAKFLNGLNINNIFLRVTGGDISNIDGTISALGKANFWLLNPSGVIFGPNAKIDIDGSFNVIAGSNITFVDGSEFAVDTNNDALLTQSAPVGVNFPGGKTPASVIILGSGHTFTNQTNFGQSGKLTSGNNRSTQDLTVSKNKDINIAATNILIDGGRLNSNGGNIKLLALSRGKIYFDNIQNNDRNIILEDIKLSNKSVIYAGSPDSNTAPGEIELIAKNITFTENSIILSQNSSSKAASDIKLSAIDNFTLVGKTENGNTANNTGIYSEMNASQATVETRGADIIVNASRINLKASNFISSTIDSASGGEVKLAGKNLEMSERGVIIAATTSTGRSGDVRVDFSTVNLLGENVFGRQDFNTAIGVINYGFGSSGKVEVFSKEIFVLDGASIANNILPGFIAKAANPSKIFSKIQGTGNDVEIKANIVTIGGAGINQYVSGSGQKNFPLPRSRGNFSISSTIGATTASSVNSGDVKLKVKELIITDGGQLYSSSLGSGNAGKIEVDATNFIILDRGKIVGAIRENRPQSQRILNLSTTPTGEVQSINVNTPKLRLLNDSEITISNVNNNAAGIANINADEIVLEASKITATTSAGSGQLNISSKDFRAINSQITTSAEATGTGGDININSDIFLANRSSQITATAVRGNGGNISLRGNDGIFISADSVVSADSESGVDGVVNISGVTQEQIGNELSFFNIKKAEEKQQQPPTTFTSDCTEENLTTNTGVNPKYDPYQDPDSPLSGLTPPEQTEETDKELLKHYATGIIMANVPSDSSQLLDYLREHFSDVRVSPRGVIQTGEIKNLERIKIPSDWLKRSFNYLEICQ